MTDKTNQQIRKFLDGWVVMGLILSVCFGTRGSSEVRAQGDGNERQAHPGGTRPARQVGLEPSFSLDGVLVSVQAASLPSTEFTVSEPGSASQVATSMSFNPFREFSVTAIPFGTRPPTEALPFAESGGKTVYDSALRSARLQQGGTVQDGPSVSLFGQQISGTQTVLALNVDGSVPKPVVIDEWVVEAGERLWIVRWSQERVAAALSPQSEISPGDLVLTSSSLNQPTTIKQPLVQNSVLELNQNPLATTLPTPTWWSGDCDTTNYSKGSKGIAAYRLGAVYRGAPACGPRPYYDSGPDVLVRFFSGAWGEYEWECVEYAMRFLYLAYGIGPYGANGSQVVWNYSGSLLTKIANGMAGLAPHPDDVLSYGATSSYGHTSVVSASNVNASGNGTITVIEENAAASGSATLNVTNWTVNGDAGAVSGWLTANPPPLTLTVGKKGTGSGTVSSNPTGINCGSTCAYTFPYNSSVTLTDAASTNSIFTGWSGAGCSGTGTCVVNLSTAQSVTANFNLAPYQVFLVLLIQ